MSLLVAIANVGLLSYCSNRLAGRAGIVCTVRILGEGFMLSRKYPCIACPLHTSKKCSCTRNLRARRPRRKAGRRRTRKVRGKSGACLLSGRGGVAGAAWYLGRSSSARMQRAQPSGCRAGPKDAVPVARPCTTGERDRRKRVAVLVPARVQTSWRLPFAWQGVRPPAIVWRDLRPRWENMCSYRTVVL